MELAALPDKARKQKPPRPAEASRLREGGPLTFGLSICFLVRVFWGSVFDSPLSLSPFSSPRPLSSVSRLLLLEPNLFFWSISFLSWIPSPPRPSCSALLWRLCVGDSLPRHALLSSVRWRMASSASRLLHSLRFGWTVLVVEQVRMGPPSAGSEPTLCGSRLMRSSSAGGRQPPGTASRWPLCLSAQPCQPLARSATQPAPWLLGATRAHVCGGFGDTAAPLPPQLMLGATTVWTFCQSSQKRLPNVWT